MNRLALLLLIVAAPGECKENIEPGTAVSPGFAEARAESVRTSRPLLVIAASPAECVKSRRLLEQVLLDPVMQEWSRATVIPVTLDPFLDQPESGRSPASPDLLEMLRIDSLPDLVLLETDGSEIGRLTFEDQTAEGLVRSLSTMLTLRRGWKDRLARLESVDVSQKLADAAHLLQHCLPLLEEAGFRVAELVYTLDPTDSTGQRADAATLVALGSGPHAADALLHLERLAPADPKKRFAFVLFQKTATTLHRMIEANEGLEPSAIPSLAVRTLARELVEQVRVARVAAPSPDVEARLVGRAALAFHLTGNAERARGLMKKAKELSR